MSRSKWKGPFVDCLKAGKSINRNIEISPKLVGKKFIVHSGYKKKIELSINEDMIGYKVGEFVNTRQIYVFKKKKQKKKQKKKINGSKNKF